MTDLVRHPATNKLGIKELLAFGAAYMMVVGACYLAGYWGSFQINVFEFISFSDVVKLAVFPLMPFLVGLFAGVFCYQLWTSGDASALHKSNRERRRSGFQLQRIFLLVVILCVVLVSFFSPMLGNFWPPLPSGLIAFFVGLLSIPLLYVDEFIEILPNRDVRLVALFLFLFVPPVSWSYGVWRAHAVKTGAAELFVDVSRSQPFIQSDPKIRLAYLGLLGDLYVLRESQSGKIIFLKKSVEAPLFLVPKKVGSTSAGLMPK